MVFSSYSNTSYLPLDNDQGVTFYKNENLLFTPPPAATAAVVAAPSTLVCRRNTAAAAAAMLTATTGSSPFGSQPLHHGSQHGNAACDDFQPVAHLSSNGYYGYVPANSIPKMMSTEETPPAAAAAVAVNGNGVGVLLDCHPLAASVIDNSSSMMDCGGGIGEVENYHHLQQQQSQHLRKRKEYSEEVEGNCKRRKTWLEQPNDAGYTHTPYWQNTSVQQMECNDQPMDTFSTHQFNGSPVTMNATTTTFNGFQLHHQQPHLQQASIAPPPMPAASHPQTVLQPKSNYTETSRCMMSHMI